MIVTLKPIAPGQPGKHSLNPRPCNSCARSSLGRLAPAPATWLFAFPKRGGGSTHLGCCDEHVGPLLRRHVASVVVVAP